MALKDITAIDRQRIRVKICGITRFDDALMAASFGVDALGFVFYDKSPRFISPHAAAKIIRALPPFVSAVGLFVNPSQLEIDHTLDSCPLDVIQLHGDETPAFCAAQQRRVIKAVPVSNLADINNISQYACSVLLDTKAPAGVYGGTGKIFDWSLLENLKHDYPLMLAGGLNVDNVNDALALKVCSALDVSSGVEQEKGIKDEEKMTLFCKKVHQFNCKV